MSQNKILVSSYLLNELKTCAQLQYSGKLDIRSTKGQTWTFFYRLGRIAWATGGRHPLRRWYRQLALYFPEINVEQMQLRQEDISQDYWDYRILANLYKKGKIQREQIKAVVDNTIAELLFDVAQQENIGVTYQRDQTIILEPLFSFTGVETSMKLMEDSWQIWLEAGLGDISPDLSPILQNPEQLRQKISPVIYKHFVTLFNGKYTLRDLAVKMKQSLLPVTRSLLPYIKKGIIELVEVSDIPLQVTDVQNKSTTTLTKKPNAPLIAFVDDSPQICQTLEEILVANRLRSLKIEDSVQALPLLIQHKPDLIFLDLIMPIASGYEICAQLRRVSLFANTPIIILTSSDGVFDRVRAKVSGSTDFMTKPITAEKVMDIIRKYLKPQTAVDNMYEANNYTYFYRA
ncbi:MAG: response regulator [Scytonema sp. PMC 1069.18]|nr:response regulator [Scytonema sp. PMC 1069.18]MEC4886709.1 response regulator [Scytonema sp. PMC 1070.18]